MNDFEVMKSRKNQLKNSLEHFKTKMKRVIWTY